MAEKTYMDLYTVKEVEGVFLCHNNNRILVQTLMKNKVLQWYHLMQVHPGEKRMERTICFVYTWKDLKADVKLVCKHCHVCQMSKNSGRKTFGLVPEKEGEVTKWSRVNIDMWGPKTICHKNGKTYKIHVMTMVDPVTGWFELAQLRDKPNACCPTKTHFELECANNGSITTELEPNVLGRVNTRGCHPYYKLPEEENDHDMNIQPTDTEVV
ncbi:hypothetical protein FRACYDRAFT_247241 [Fragilariopsis cylindrus CCMP1102]|uniref:Integrase zinc-binding domain-containing protein n=1 Tax=Fragilariopsis cylindrus CCMP1102 TaxID=635003 RepID=A0A1E7EW95_9STRA|nr:hypothetical protein FRACYDRAFT_247241 [Fragilariopsis cylindrus CCMP1102]|eukprot:OEU10300.1 hypothetical protein FRACYDRAFT_247241 [Fragilariopsis cylindrus CCMP1102]